MYTVTHTGGGYMPMDVSYPITLVEEIIEISLNTEEKKLLNSSADSVKKVMKLLDDLKLFEE